MTWKVSILFVTVTNQILTTVYGMKISSIILVKQIKKNLPRHSPRTKYDDVM